MASNNKDKKVYFITGGSKGFGLCLTNEILKRGFNCASTSRNTDELCKSVDSSLVTNDNFLPLQVDLCSDESIKKSIQDTISKFGRIDVIINNAGYSQIGTVEELTDKEVRTQFEVNFFSVVSVIRNSLPFLRSNKQFPEGPRIISITSVGGITGNFPSFGIYCATKFAVEGLSESLRQDVKEFNIHVSTVLPGYFRTSFLEKGHAIVPHHPIKEYTAVRKVQEMHENNINGNQQGDPVKGAKVIIDFSLKENPETHLYLGSDSIKYTEEKLNQVKSDINANYDSCTSTDYTQ